MGLRGQSPKYYICIYYEDRTQGTHKLLQELVEDVAVATSSRHADLSWARRFAVASPRYTQTQANNNNNNK